MLQSKFPFPIGPFTSGYFPPIQNVRHIAAFQLQIGGREGSAGLGVVGEQAQWDATEEAVTEPPSPLPSPSKLADREQPKKDELVCKQCGRAFMSLKGLLSHERSHTAMANMKKLNNLSTSAVKQM